MLSQKHTTVRQLVRELARHSVGKGAKNQAALVKQPNYLCSIRFASLSTVTLEKSE